MPAEFAIPYFEVEAVIAVINRRDQRDLAHPLFNLFPRRGQRSPKIKIRYTTRRPSQVRHTSWGGQAVPVERGQIKESLAEPAVLKVFDTLTFEDVALFQAAADARANNQIEGIGGAAIAEANSRILQIGQDLGDDLAEERHRLMVGACLGSATLIVYDAANSLTVSYGIPTITAPSTPWDQAGAKIVEDFQKAINDFRDNNPRGLSPDTVIYNPGLYAEAFVGNTQWNEYIKQIPSMAQGFMRVPGGLNPFEISGEVNTSLFGLNWVRVEGTYNARNPSTNALTPTQRWPVGKLTLLNARELRAAWQMVVHPWQNPESAVNVEVKLPTYGEAVKAAQVTAFDNGLPMFEDPTLIQTYEVIPA